MEEFYKNLFKVMSASEVGNAHSECRRSKIFRVKTKGYFGIFQQKLSQIPLQYHGILRNPSLKLKTVAGNAILLNYAVSSENISKCIKSKTENGFYLKVIVCKFR